MSRVWVNIIHTALTDIMAEEGLEGELSFEEVVAEQPPKPEMGDLAFPMFVYSKILRKAPQVLAQKVAEKLEGMEKSEVPGTVSQAGGYLNVFIDRPGVIKETLITVFSLGEEYGKSKDFSGKKIMVEFSCPNTNKPLHLGHLRNDALGESITNILKSCGGDVRKVNLINDRGVHICKSMLAYQQFGENSDPADEGIKSDHFVGDYYVKYDQWAKEDPSAETKAQDMLKLWERGDETVTALWKKMNGWAISGIEETYERTGIHFDQYYFESETYKLGKDEVVKGLEQGAFYRDGEGTVWVDLEDIDLDKKVLLRKDGTSLYLTQDLGTAISRYADWPFDRLIYVVGSEQQYHFTVLFHVLKKLGYSWAKDLYHLSYGMVNLPEGKMKSREGTVVDADDLIEELQVLAEKEIREKERVDDEEKITQTASAIALGALNYYLLRINPSKDMIFNPKESISFNGETGPYLQYVGARISSMLLKYDEKKDDHFKGTFNPELLTAPEEWELVKLLSEYPNIVMQAAEKLDPSRIAGFLYDIAKVYSRYYHDYPILHNENEDLVETRVQLCRAIVSVLRNAFLLIGIPFLSAM